MGTCDFQEDIDEAEGAAGLATAHRV